MNDTKINIFIKEIGYIKKERYRDNIKKLISYLPDYFFEIPASSTGKYHPHYALGEGGLVRHTKVAVRIAYELLNDESITHVVLIGRFKWDVRVRLKYARVPDKKIVMLDNMADFVKTILEETKGDIYTMVCFDMTAILLNKIKEYQDGNN